jgi:uncharacterized protein (UPF0297 family)
MATLKKTFAIFLEKVKSDSTSDDTKVFASDVLLDKCFEINGKIDQLRRDLSLSVDESYKTSLSRFQSAIEAITHGVRQPDADVPELEKLLDNYNRWLDKALNDLRHALYEKGWNSVKSIDPTQYMLGERRKFIDARGELEKAKTLIQRNEMDDVITHVRSAIEFALKEKFGFRDIKGMKTFIDDAERHTLPIVSYDLIYKIYDFGSKRVHKGRILEPFEAEQILRVVSRYVEQLEMLQVPQSKIDEFKAKSSSVE